MICPICNEEVNIHLAHCDEQDCLTKYREDKLELIAKQAELIIRDIEQRREIEKLKGIKEKWDDMNDDIKRIRQDLAFHSDTKNLIDFIRRNYRESSGTEVSGQHRSAAASQVQPGAGGTGTGFGKHRESK